MSLSTLPLEVGELIFSEVVWDGFRPELVENLNSASDCIDRVHERNRQLRALRTTAKLVDCIVNRLAHKYIHITSQTRADELINADDDLRLQGAAVRHLFLGDKSGRYHIDNAPSYKWDTAEWAKLWIESRTFYKLLNLMPNLISLHIHLPGIHSQLFGSSLSTGKVAPLNALRSIRYLSLYDDINNSKCYESIKKLAPVRNSLSAFPNLQHLIVSESEGVDRLDRLIGISTSHVSQPYAYAPRLEKILLEKWCPMADDVMLYNLAMEIPLSHLEMSRRVPRRMSMQDMHTIIGKMGQTLTSLHLDFSYHFADDLNTTDVHLCATIRDNCQNLEYLTLSFPPPDRLHDAPYASVCHQLFRAPNSGETRGVGMLNLKKAEIIGHHSYCEGSSRKMIIDASEEVWEIQNQSCWEASSESGGPELECVHTNIQIHGTPAKEASLLNRRELCGIPSPLSQLSSHYYYREGQRLWDMHKPDGRPILILAPPSVIPYKNSIVSGLVSSPKRRKRKYDEVEGMEEAGYRITDI